MADPSKVFIVHGRNNDARKAMLEFLRALRLHPIEWTEAITATGNASPYVGDVLSKGFEMAQAVVVLMTPDDEARLRISYRDTDEPPHETHLTGQPRQNVLLEAGMALGTHPERTVIVEIGQLRPMSDTFGRHVIRMDSRPETRQDLATRLATAGCEVNRDGTDWLSAGDFGGCLTLLEGMTSPEEEQDFIENLDGLSGTEIYWLANAVLIEKAQTLTGCGWADPTAATLVSKGLLTPVENPNRPPKMSIPHTIPNEVWRHLNQNKRWLLDQALTKNQDHSVRLEELSKVVLEEPMDNAEQVMRKRRDVLRKLAE